ncbi:glycosyltransferase [candidate division KSB1 bacterium]|nr:glycosyltransferase [candidate division KSB1 bacterium]NIR72092.1 glycosyltransferase [candidate division KSB1 bacterium]NIS24356.1 glycosyltransferase [candidate division KSB1 bacterium]NIT71288.1 glycosyltransferase [candidate division KSB1 bacterium]NIU24989.1 glycosyltransferase [candidate division KSB1 bacterium]
MSDKSRPEVTIIVPYYNHARYFEQCLSSIKAQTYPNFSVILVDDCSHELLKPAISQNDQPNIRIIRHKINRGPAAARNTGIRASATEIFVCVDADDMIEPTFLERLVSVIWQDDTIDCVFGDVRLFGSDDRIVTYKIPTIEDILRSQAIPGAGTMMRKRLWERLGGYDEADPLRRGREDWEYYIRAFSSGCRAARVAEPLYRYRILNKSLNFTCRLHDAEVAQYIYNKHRELFDSIGQSDRFLSFGFYKAAISWYNHGYRGKAFRFAFKAWRLDGSNDRLKLVLRTALPPAIVRRLGNGELRRRLPFLGYPLNSEERYTPFFVIGSGRSGSTLFRRILTTHSELHIPPENFGLGTSIRKYQQFSKIMIWSDLVHLIMSLFEFHHEFYTFEVSLRPLVNELIDIPHNRRNLAYMLDRFYRYHAERHGCSMVRWGDKTPLISYEPGALEDILKVFPDAQFIHLARDGCDVISSTLRYGFFTSLTTAAHRWVRVVQQTRDFTKAHPERSMLVRYEDLVRQPEATTKAVCQFLNVTFEQQMLSSEDFANGMGDVPVLSEHREVAKPINDSNIGTGRRDFSDQEKEKLQSIIGRELEAFGYPPCFNSQP